jgi:hypothetical protein
VYEPKSVHNSVMKIMPILSLCLWFAWLVLPSPAIAFTQNQELFVAIDKCDLQKMEKLLKDGAETEALYEETLRPHVRIQANSSFTALAYATMQACVDQINMVALPEEKISTTKILVSKMIDLLMRYGARPDHQVSYSTGWKVPILHLPFYGRMGMQFGIGFYLQMIKNGASPHILDERGFNVLKAITDMQWGWLNEEEYESLLNSGADFMQIGPKGLTHAGLFPNFSYSEGFLEGWMETLLKRNFDYRTGDFTSSQFAHPLVRSFYNLAYSNSKDIPSFRNKLKFFREKLLPFAKDTWEMASGKQLRPILAEMMIAACPTTEYTQMLSFSFGVEQDERSIKKNQQLNESYLLLRSLIKSNDLNLLNQDQDNKDILTYALHLCPFEVVQDIIKIIPDALTQNHLTNLEESIKGISKYQAKTTFLNNDHRTLRYLTSKGLSLEKQSLAALGVRNQLMLHEGPLLSWNDLESTGLDLDNVSKLNFISAHTLKKYTDIKETLIPLIPNGGKKQFRFTGAPISISLSTKENILTSEPLRIFKEIAGIDYEIRNGYFHYKLVKGVETNESALINGNLQILKIRQNRSGQKETFQSYRREQVNLKRGEKVKIDISDSIRSDYSLDKEYVQMSSIDKCKQKLCSYIEIERSGTDAFISINEKKFLENDPELFWLWNYLQTPIQSRKNLINELSKTASPNTLSYFLQLIRTKLNDHWEEQESLGLLDLLINKEISGQLPFDITPIQEKLKEIEGLSKDGTSFVQVRQFFLTGEDISSAVSAVTSSEYHFDEFIQLTKSLEPVQEYQRRVKELRTTIRDNLPTIAERLNLSNEAIDRYKELL